MNNIIKVTLTSFEPFGKYKYNPTISVMNNVQSFFENSVNIEITTRILQCKYSTIKNEVYDIYNENPDIIISLGLRANTSYLNLESIAHNEYSSITPDNDGITLSGNKIIDSSENLISTIDLDKLQILSDKCVDSIVSKNAGKFMCNANFFWNQYKLNSEKINSKYLFIHIPFTDKYIDLEQEISNNNLPVLKEDNIVRSIISIIKNLSKSEENKLEI